MNEADRRPSTPPPDDEQELEDFASAPAPTSQPRSQSPPSRTHSTSPFPPPADGQIRPFRDYDDDEAGHEHEGVGERDILGQQQSMMNGESGGQETWGCVEVVGGGFGRQGSWQARDFTETGRADAGAPYAVAVVTLQPQLLYMTMVVTASTGL